MPLSLAEADKEYKIQRVGGKAQIRQHLETLGFIPGETVTLISSNNGNVIVIVKGTRIAISEEMARKIYI